MLPADREEATACSTIGDLAKVPGTVRHRGAAGVPHALRGARRACASCTASANVRVKQLKIGEQYAALDDGKADAADVFTTDGQLEKGRYVLLSDPKNLFSFQNVAPVISHDSSRRTRASPNIIDSVSSKLTTPAMRAMNAAVVQRGEKPAAVAEQFLRRAGLINGRGGSALDEGKPRGLAALLLHRRLLLFGARLERGQVEIREPRLGHLLKRTPQRELARDAEREALELDDPAERRVREQRAVQLDQADLLAHERTDLLDRVLADARARA